MNEKVRELIHKMNRHVKEYVYDNGHLQSWKTVDPERLEEFWRLHDWLDHCCTLYIDNKIPWDRDVLMNEVEVLQTGHSSTPVAVTIPRIDLRPSVMQAARDLLTFVVLS